MKLLDVIVVNILSFQIIDIFFMNFATIILFLPTTLPHTHDSRPLPTTHDPRHLAALKIKASHLWPNYPTPVVSNYSLKQTSGSSHRALGFFVRIKFSAEFETEGQCCQFAKSCHSSNYGWFFEPFLNKTILMWFSSRFSYIFGTFN